ncbi:hypothetical protein BAUCODRAFT_221421 [Baudoinia panamericana UAMH 10762]|uniref:Uncharacterized protein n=1 Tax=Baudoinia panamericana (strain UAMH 10762) TaxID=717646 RepID=M2N521_BAUPA|nr:uncharacterized protein BAUCODRAFT_221421 [Baudoinia panamericana UAMH 10762]EMC94124.1 hypothetical protein BAUCODRAFT_221421 [Baudoinia panamericana UAMH 10762]
MIIRHSSNSIRWASIAVDLRLSMHERSAKSGLGFPSSTSKDLPTQIARLYILQTIRTIHTVRATIPCASRIRDVLREGNIPCCHGSSSLYESTSTDNINGFGRK